MTHVALFYRLVCDDISGGQEKLMIPASNLVDNPPLPPTGKFTLEYYIDMNKLQNLKLLICIFHTVYRLCVF